MEAGIGSTILQRFEVAQIVTDLSTATVKELLDHNMVYGGVTKYTIGSRGFNSEVVRWAAVDGGCLPALIARNGSAPIMCKRKGSREQLEALGFTIQVLYQNVLYVNIRQVETALHVAFKDHPNRLWRCTGSGGNNWAKVRVEGKDCCVLQLLGLTQFSVVPRHPKKAQKPQYILWGYGNNGVVVTLLYHPAATAASGSAGDPIVL